MFDSFRPLLDASVWLRELDNVAFDYVARALKDVLGLESSARLVRTKRSPRVAFRQFGAELLFEELSDGSQSVLGLTCDGRQHEIVPELNVELPSWLLIRGRQVRFTPASVLG
jgi:hypothetical protein